MHEELKKKLFFDTVPHFSAVYTFSASFYRATIFKIFVDSIYKTM